MAVNVYSFDIVSKVDIPEMENAINQARKEIDNRFDFKGTGSRIEKGKEELALSSSDEFHLNSMLEVLENRLVKRGVPLKAIHWQHITDGPKGTVRREGQILQGIDQDKAREIMKFVKKVSKRINVAVQQDQLRVSAKNKDDLQEVMKEVRERDFGIHLQFTNYR